MRECIYSKQYGGKKFLHWFCCHVWHISPKVALNKLDRIYSDGVIPTASIIIEKNECIECGRTEILVLVDGL